MATTVQTRKLYNDSITLYFNPSARNRYQLHDGKAPVGVTTVLSKVLAKEALMLWPMYQALSHLDGVFRLTNDSVEFTLTKDSWASLRDAAIQAHRLKSDKGKDIGTEVHEAIELQLKESLPHARYDGLSPEAKKAVDAMARWIDEAKPQVIATELIVYSREHNYAGTFDALLEIDGKTVLCDVKTSNTSRTSPTGIYPEYFLQLGAYARAYKEAGGKPIDELMVINAGKDGNLHTLKASDLGLSVEVCENTWLSVLNIYRFMEPLKKVIQETK